MSHTLTGLSLCSGRGPHPTFHLTHSFLHAFFYFAHLLIFMIHSLIQQTSVECFCGTRNCLKTFFRFPDFLELRILKSKTVEFVVSFRIFPQISNTCLFIFDIWDPCSFFRNCWFSHRSPASINCGEHRDTRPHEIVQESAVLECGLSFLLGIYSWCFTGLL